jgi:hypothetical protein
MKVSVVNVIGADSPEFTTTLGPTVARGSPKIGTFAENVAVLPFPIPPAYDVFAFNVIGNVPGTRPAYVAPVA